MMRGSEQMGYDRGLTVFSPEGRLYQVEYALEAVKRGTLAIAIKGTDGAVIVVHKKISSPLIDPSKIHKVFIVDKHIGVAISGLHADARILTDQARLQAAIFRLNYEEEPLIDTIVRKICDLTQAYSQHGGVRPFGAALMFVGIDDKGPQVYTTSPSGTFFSWIARAIGYKSDETQDYLKEEYKVLKPLDELKVYAMSILKKFVDEDLTPDTVEVGIISSKEKTFKMLNGDERKVLLDATTD
ncbi:MAG: archaeal proteasome endopeptidase complex subunit alpha [Promethearchaeota archaeon]